MKMKLNKEEEAVKASSSLFENKLISIGFRCHSSSHTSMGTRRRLEMERNDSLELYPICQVLLYMYRESKSVALPSKRMISVVALGVKFLNYIHST